MPEAMLKPVLLAGLLLCVMSVIDTLAYGVRTAGVLTRKLAISLSLFNILVLVSRLGNMVSAPVLGNFPDKVYQGQYSADEVLLALRYCLLFVVAGVVIGGLLMPSLIAVFSRGITVLEARGTLPRALWHGLRTPAGLLRNLRPPRLQHLRDYSSFGALPYHFLFYNVFVTCFYSLGVISTVQAASLDHSVASTAILLSGIVNGIATLILFVIVDPPGAVIVEQCISGKRPVSHAKIMNVALVVTRLLGTLLALLLLPAMAQYVLTVARFVDRSFSAVDRVQALGAATTAAHGLDYELSLRALPDGTLEMELRVHNNSDKPVELVYSSGMTHDFTLRQAGEFMWQASAGQRYTQALRAEQFPPRAVQRYSATVSLAELNAASTGEPLELEALHPTLPPVRLGFSFSLPPGQGDTP